VTVGLSVELFLEGDVFFLESVATFFFVSAFAGSGTMGLPLVPAAAAFFGGAFLEAAFAGLARGASLGGADASRADRRVEATMMR